MGSKATLRWAPLFTILFVLGLIFGSLASSNYYVKDSFAQDLSTEERLSRESYGLCLVLEGMTKAFGAEGISCEPPRSQPLDCKQLGTCRVSTDRPQAERLTTDLNEEDRKFCQKFRATFYSASCLLIKWLTEANCLKYTPFLGKDVCKRVGEGAGVSCGLLGARRVAECGEEYPPIIHYR